MPQTQMHGRFYGTGKRKNAVARVFLKPGEAGFSVNGRELDEYFRRESLVMIAQQPFDHTGEGQTFHVSVRVCGGGNAAQAQAVRHGLSRALQNMDESLRPALKKAGFLTRDARKKERKKPGQPGARKKFQYSKR